MVVDPISDFFSRKNIAVVGATDHPGRYGYKVFRRLVDRGHRVFPVHPVLDAIDGIKVYRALGDVPEPIEAVDLVVNPSVTERVVEECARLGIGLVWMQPGSESPAAIEYCEKNGITCIHDTCVLSYPR